MVLVNVDKISFWRAGVVFHSINGPAFIRARLATDDDQCPLQPAAQRCLYVSFLGDESLPGDDVLVENNNWTSDRRRLWYIFLWSSGPAPRRRHEVYIYTAWSLLLKCRTVGRYSARCRGCVKLRELLALVHCCDGMGDSFSCWWNSE